MKRITSSVGLVALGAASLQAQYAPGLSQMETSKPWTISAAVRGFYDDNYTTSPSDFSQESFGFEVAPEVGVRWVLDQTLIRASYKFSGKFYEDDSHWDQSHLFDASVDHAFSERYNIKLTEQFSVAQEPDVFFPDSPILARGNEDHVRNLAGVTFNGMLTQTVGYELAYQNGYFDYDNFFRSQELDRKEHKFTFDPTWVLQDDTMLRIGGMYKVVDLDNDTALNPDYDVIYGFVGVDHDFNSQLSGSARFGFYYADYDNDGGSKTSPYADVNMTYTYADLSSIQLGFKIDQNVTDVASALSQAITGGYFVWNHQLAPKLGAKVSGAINSSEFDGGVSDGAEEVFGSISVGLTYLITEHFSAEAGYTFSRVDSDSILGTGVDSRSYSRNRIYLGVGATF